MRKILLTLYFSIFITICSYGMTLNELPIIGSIPNTDIVNIYLSYYPSSVATLYRQKGGKIIIIPCKRIDNIAKRYDCYTKNVEGLYVFKSKKIYLANTDNIAVNLAHELGHFLFEETRPSWSKDMKLRWTDSEDFAQHYSRRDSDFISIEQDIKKLIIQQ